MQLGKTAAHAADFSGSPVDVQGMWLATFPSAMNNQLRTGADKGNPTVSKLIQLSLSSTNVYLLKIT